MPRLPDRLLPILLCLSALCLSTVAGPPFGVRGAEHADHASHAGLGLRLAADASLAPGHDAAHDGCGHWDAEVPAHAAHQGHQFESAAPSHHHDHACLQGSTPAPSLLGASAPTPVAVAVAALPATDLLRLLSLEPRAHRPRGPPAA